MALVMAQENFMSREPVADIWIVNRKNIREMDTRREKDAQPTR